MSCGLHTVFGFRKVNTVYEHEYYAKVKGEGEVASKREDKLTNGRLYKFIG